MKTENAAGYLYDFYQKETRGLAQAPIEREAESQPVSFRAELVPTGFLSVDGWSQTLLECGKLVFCRVVLFSTGSVILVCMLSYMSLDVEFDYN